MPTEDSVLSFTLGHHSIRVVVVQLRDSWRQLHVAEKYPSIVCSLLGQLTVAASLLSLMIKYEGRITVQIQGDSAIRFLVAECQHDLTFRATAKLQRGIAIDEHAGVQALVNAEGRGRCAITLDQRLSGGSHQAYQGIVALEGGNLAEMLQGYMQQSEQLETRFWLAADAGVASGVMIQKMPQREQAVAVLDEDAWDRAIALASTLRNEELLNHSSTRIVELLFSQEEKSNLQQRTPRFACTCSREKISCMLTALGKSEVEATLEHAGVINVACDYCGSTYAFSADDVRSLFGSSGRISGNPEPPLH